MSPYPVLSKDVLSSQWCWHCAQGGWTFHCFLGASHTQVLAIHQNLLLASTSWNQGHTMRLFPTWRKDPNTVYRASRQPLQEDHMLSTWPEVTKHISCWPSIGPYLLDQAVLLHSSTERLHVLASILHSEKMRPLQAPSRGLNSLCLT